MIIGVTALPTMAEQSQNSDFLRANELLTGLGFNDVSLMASNEITRGEFIDLLVANSFYDNVQKDDLPGIGLYSDTNYVYLPEKSITIKEAITFCIKLLTFNSETVDDYLITEVNSRLKLSRGILNDWSSPITYEQAYILIYNYLTADISVYGNRFSIGNTTILADKYNISIIEGYVDAVGSYTLGTSPVSEGKISVANEVYINNRYDERYFGKLVECYVKDDESGKEVVALVESGTSKVYEISSEMEPTFIGREYTFLNESGKEISVDISTKADVFFNGAQSSIKSEIATPESGYVRIIDNNKYADGADIVIIESSKAVKIDAVQGDEEYIYGGGMNYNLNDCELIHKSSGEAIDISSLSKGDLVSIYCDNSGKVWKVVKLQNVITGKLSEVSRNAFKIGDVNYRVIAEVYADAKSRLGESVSAVLDSYGTVVYVTTDSLNFANVGITLNYKTVKKGVLNKLYVEIYDADAKRVAYEVAEKAKINGRLWKSLNEFERNLPKVGSNIKQSIVTFDLDNDSKIISIDFPSDKIMDVDGLANIYKTGEDQMEVNSSVEYKQWSRILGKDIFISVDDTVVFKYPKQLPDGTTSDDEDMFSVFKCNSLTSGTTFVAVSRGWSLDKNDKVADYVTLEYEASSSGALDEIGNDTYLSMVEDVVKTLDKDGFPIEAIVLYDNIYPKGHKILGKDENYFTSRNIAPGDLVRVDYYPDTKVAKGAELVYKKGSNTLANGTYLYDGNGGGINAQAEIHMRDVYQTFGMVLDCVYPDADLNNISDSDIKPIRFDGHTGFKYNEKRGKVERATIDDVYSYDIAGEGCSTIIFHTRWLDPKSIYIVN